jgi:hypothetical protein
MTIFMRLLKGLTLMSVMWTATPAIACSLAGSQPFRPSMPDEPKTDPVTGGVAKPPVLTLVSASVSRGSGNDGSSCDDAGTARITITLPPDSPYFIDELGFYVRTIAGEPVVSADLPMTALGVDPRTGTLMLHWLDGAPSEQRPLDLDLEVSALTHDLALGPPLRFRVRADVGARVRPDPREWDRAIAQQLVAYAASDFAAGATRVAAVRDVRLRARADDDVAETLLCGMFRRTDQDADAWIAFATVLTDPYEQWLGGQAEAMCARADAVSGVEDLTPALQARLGVPRSAAGAEPSR